MSASNYNILGLVELANEESDDIRSQTINQALNSAFSTTTERMGKNQG